MIKWQKKSILSRLSMMTLVIVLSQTLLLVALLVFGGVFNQAELNAYQTFYDKVNNRRDYLQREMKNRWTNISPYLMTIRKAVTENADSHDDFFEASVDELILMLRTNQVTGAFIILNESRVQDYRYPSLYIRDYDPQANGYTDDDLYMVSGPSDLAKNLQIPLDQGWQYNLQLTEENTPFIQKPIENAMVTSKSNLVGYWSKPFKLMDGDMDIITYSMPLLDLSGELVGVVGVEISVSYLSKFLPATDLQPRDSLGYIIAYKEDTSDALIPIVTAGALQQRLIDTSHPLELSLEDQSKKIYRLTNHFGNEAIYASYEKLGLYAQNTPFENEEWYLIGFMRSDYLLSYVNRIAQILEISIALSIGIGILGGIIISYQLSKPIIGLAKEVRDSNQMQVIKLSSTGLKELDELSYAVETANKMMLDSASRLSKIIDLVALPIGAFEMSKQTEAVFVTDQFYDILEMTEAEILASHDKSSFTEMLRRIFSNPEPEEENVFKLSGMPTRWVKVMIKETDNDVLGVIQNVTDEILEKNQIKQDRDLDPLTKLYNRKGFQWRAEKIIPAAKGANALLMFDLDYLKQINDSYGHKWGDMYIINAVENLKKTAPEEHMLLGRRSGDEFVMLLHDYETKEEIVNAINQFFVRLEERKTVFPDGSLKAVRISAGLLWLSNKSLSYDEMLHYADEALYDSKRYNKGSYTVSQLN
ncbi:MAG: hypothetical protein BGO41_10410 [Clostridiales bacterium 38-18]|nr:MAG: hypothetical protein BGO41_10410 [Clostridiales bacterium 38-18]